MLMIRSGRIFGRDSLMAQKRLQLVTVRILLTLVLLSLIPAAATAEDGHAAWLRYAPLEPAARARAASLVPDRIVTRGDSPQILRARDELIRGIRGMVGREVRPELLGGGPRTMVIGTSAQLAQLRPFAIAGALARDGYAIETVRDGGAAAGTVIAGESDRAVLYGVFAYLRTVALGQLSADLRERSAPAAPVRWLNHWENVDGTIERGYGGRSILWEGGRLRDDLSLVNDYGRLLASLGINGLSINNVNANPAFLTLEFLPQISQVADVLRPWGVQVVLAVDFASPEKVGKLGTYDPLDPRVGEWWKNTIDNIYSRVPDLAGIVLKADSEGRVGPSAYKRTHADAANVIA